MGRKIIFTGGGSGGHVFPAVSLMEQIIEQDMAEVFYIGRHFGIEKEILSQWNSRVSYKGISSGKLRRYFSIKNLIDVFKVIYAVFESFFYLIKFSKKETIVFSTGGFVSVPVVIASWLQGKKIIIHEQTSRIGLANKISSLFAHKVLLSFDKSMEFFPKEKSILTGLPLRKSFYDPKFSNVKINDVEIMKLEKPLLLITGGGNGSELLNQKMIEFREELLREYSVILQVGKEHFIKYKSLSSLSFLVVDQLGDEIVDLYKFAKIILSRSGAGTVSELMALNKPSIFIPLKIAQQNEQFCNAQDACEKIGSLIIEEDEFKNLNFKQLVSYFEKIPEKKKHEIKQNAVEHIINIIHQQWLI